MADYKEMLTYWANEPYITHDDPTKCGLCLQEKIKSEVAKEMLEKCQEIGVEELKQVMNETKRRFRETDIYKRVRKMLDEGKTIEQAEEEMKKEGIEI